MRVVIGPVDARSAQVWLTYADGVLDELGTMAPGACFTSPDTVEFLRGFVRSWELSVTGDVFLWEEDIPAERVEYSMHAFHRVVDLMSRRAEEHGRSAPPEGDAFYVAVLQGVLRALETESASSAAFARDLAESWPGWLTIS
jgi:hypothetical protein